MSWPDLLRYCLCLHLQSGVFCQIRLRSTKVDFLQRTDELGGFLCIVAILCLTVAGGSGGLSDHWQGWQDCQTDESKMIKVWNFQQVMIRWWGFSEFINCFVTLLVSNHWSTLFIRHTKNWDYYSTSSVRFVEICFNLKDEVFLLQRMMNVLHWTNN